MTPGYYRNPEATEATVTQDGWMDSGDLAYWAGGELYITGRTKDLIIKAGRNVMPQEVEAAAAEVPGVRRGCVAAFGTVDSKTGTERLVVVAETRATAPEDLRRIESAMIKKVDAVVGIPPDQAVLVPPQTIPKTSSGKIRRKETCSLYERGELKTTKKPPWVQIIRLAMASFDSWVGVCVGHFSASLRRMSTRASLLIVGTSAGLLARLMPRQKAGAKIARSAARFLVRLSGQRVMVEGSDLFGNGQPAVFIANRAGRNDPLVLAASLPSPFLISSADALASMPQGARFLLDPFVIAPLSAEATPPGGTIRERIHRTLENGHSVLVFPDGPIGASAHLSRYRLDAFHAAVATSTPILPIGIKETSCILDTSRSSKFENREPRTENRSVGRVPAAGNVARIFVGVPIRAQETDHNEMTRLRERVRESIARLIG
jgi:hypothetical protein